MHLTIRIKYLVIAAIAFGLLVGGFYVYLGYALRHMELDLSGLGPTLNKLAATVEVVTLTIPKCESSVDHIATGDPRREATMLYVATVVDLYTTMFGKLPDNIEDLDRLPSFENADRLNGSRVKKRCSIRSHPSGSYVLACDAPLPPAKDIQSVLGKNGRVQKFEMVGGTEILYVPGTGCR